MSQQWQRWNVNCNTSIRTATNSTGGGRGANINFIYFLVFERNNVFKCGNHLGANVS